MDIKIEVPSQLILKAVTTELQNSFDEFTTVVSISPVQRDEDGLYCWVGVVDPEKKGPDFVTIGVAEKKEKIALRFRKEPRAIFYACPGENTPTSAPPGEGGACQGGDGCWPDAAPADWGTVGVLAQTIRIRNRAGQTVTANNACLSAGHVFGNAQQGDRMWASGELNPYPMTFVGALPMAGTPVDAALASFDDPAQMKSRFVRGFPQPIAGVRAPRDNMWITTRGAKSARPTIGLDKKACTLQVDGITFLGVRKTTPGFSCCHDSGAAVLDIDNYFVGMIFAGQRVPCDQYPYSWYVPARPWGDPVDQNVYDLEIQIT